MRNLKTKILISILYFLTNCGTFHPDKLKEEIYYPEDPRKQKGVHSEFVKYYTDFELRYNVIIGDIPANFETLDPGTLGVCRLYYYNNKIYYKEILIDDKKWFSLTEDSKEYIIYHELGHCFFLRDHDTRFITSDNENIAPRSIMYPNDFSYMDFYKENKEHYFEELIGESF